MRSRVAASAGTAPIAVGHDDALGAAVSGAALASRLGCGGCHDAPFPPAGSAAPQLGDAGRKYRSAYLAAYIAAPVTVRAAIAPARMPTFPLHDGEAEAMAAYLATLERGEALPAVRGGRGDRSRGEELIIGAAGCLACHTLNGVGAGSAVDLAQVTDRLDRHWVRALLIDPERVQPGTGMPALFYERTTAGYRERAEGAGAQLDDIVAYLFEGSGARADRRRRAESRTIEHGRALIDALNCAACHSDLATAPSGRRAPDLRRSAAALQAAALRAYLRAPHPVRPFGDPPGSGGRMPDFRLSDAEADALASWLLELAPPLPAATLPAATLPAALPRYAHATAETLLRERLPCLGCHALDGAGGRIAPELGAVAARLEPTAIAAVIDDPAAHRPGSIMPRVPLSPYERRRVIGYLLGRDRTTATPAYLSPADHPRPAAATSAGRVGGADYVRYCAACHGTDGGGQGFNARYLDTAPTRHNDAAYMQERPDDALYDAIAVGGRIMGRSAAMPMFGETIDAARLRMLVAYMRALCDCTGPAWSER